jgi:hypothetical protein
MNTEILCMKKNSSIFLIMWDDVGHLYYEEHVTISRYKVFEEMGHSFIYFSSTTVLLIQIAADDATSSTHKIFALSKRRSSFSSSQNYRTENTKYPLILLHRPLYTLHHFFPFFPKREQKQNKK